MQWYLYKILTAERVHDLQEQAVKGRRVAEARRGAAERRAEMNSAAVEPGPGLAETGLDVAPHTYAEFVTRSADCVRVEPAAIERHGSSVGR